MAMGADTAIHVELDARADQDLQPLAVAKLLQKIVDKVQPDLVIAGKQAIDDDSAQAGQMLAGLLNWPQATFASKVDVDAASKKATVVREKEGGLETVTFGLPAVITTDLRLNTPRYATLPNIMKGTLSFTFLLTLLPALLIRALCARPLAVLLFFFFALISCAHHFPNFPFPLPFLQRVRSPLRRSPRRTSASTSRRASSTSPSRSPRSVRAAPRSTPSLTSLPS
jgi:hypothetical protein